MTKRPRVRVTKPTFNPVDELPTCTGWATNYIRKNLWRVTRVPYDTHTFEDMVQDAMVYFLVCADRYEDVTDARHFMALFKTCVTNHVHKHATRITRRPDHAYGLAGHDSADDALDLIATYDNALAELHIRLLVEDAPPAIQTILAQCDVGLPAYDRDGVTRETTKEYFRRIAGVAADVDVQAMIDRWIDGIPQPAAY